MYESNVETLEGASPRVGVKAHEWGALYWSVRGSCSANAHRVLALISVISVSYSFSLIDRYFPFPYIPGCRATRYLSSFPALVRMLLEHTFSSHFGHSCLPTCGQQFYFTLQYIRTLYYVSSTSVLCLLAHERLRWASYVLSITFTCTYLAQNRAIFPYRWIDIVLCLLARKRLRTGWSSLTDKSPRAHLQSVPLIKTHLTQLKPTFIKPIYP